MRISSATRATAATKAGSPRRRGNAGAFEPTRTANERRTNALRAPAALTSTDAVLVAQMFDDGERRKRQTVKQGTRMLDLLDELKVGLLAGRVRERRLKELEGLLEEARDHALDPQLADLMKQIDLRARVELAKLLKNRA